MQDAESLKGEGSRKASAEQGGELGVRVGFTVSASTAFY